MNVYQIVFLVCLYVVINVLAYVKRDESYYNNFWMVFKVLTIVIDSVSLMYMLGFTFIKLGQL